jgi:hypothetical protein
VVVETRDVTGFGRIDLAGEGTVAVSLGGEPSVTIETDDNLMEYVEATVSDDTLTLRTVGEGAFDIDPTDSVVWRVTVPSLVDVAVSGAGSVDVPGFSGERLDVAIGGVGDITLPGLAVDTLAVVVDGVGTITADGTADSVDVTQSGVGIIDLSGVETAAAAVLITSTSDVAIWATERVEISGDGLGSISVYGSPTISGGGDRVTLLGDR